MADLLTSPDKTKQRTDGHRSKFFVSVAIPAVLLSAQVNSGALARGAIAIPFDNGTSVGVSLLRAGQTVKVVNVYGTFVTRLASVSTAGSSPNITGTLTVDPNNIVWPDNGPLVVEDMHDPRSIPPEFDAGTGISKKRSEVFSGQTSQPRPIVKMGGHKVKMLSAGSAVFDLNGSGIPVAPGATISSYLWQCAEGTIASPTSQNTTITFTSAGGRWVYLTITDSNGKTDIGVRHYFTHDSDPESDDYPYVDFELPQIPLSFDGGSQISLNVTGISDFSVFRDGALVIVWRMAWFGDTEGPISFITGSENVLFVGYIVKDTISTDAQYGTVAFEVVSPVNIMKSLPMQALSIHAEMAILYWFQTERRMTLVMILQWLLYWHSNVLTVFEWNIPTGGLYKKLFKFNEGTLYAMAADIAARFDGAVVGCDKAGRMHVEHHVNLMDQTGRDAVPVISDIVSSDWREKQVIPRKHRRATPAVAGKGFYYDGASVLTPYCSIAPTKIRETSGSNLRSIEGMVVSSQAHLDRLTGRYLALDNREIEEVRLGMAGDYSVMDVFPQRWWRMSLDAGDTPRGISATDMRLLPRTVTLFPDTKNGVLLVDAVFEPEVFGPDGVFDPCPTEGTLAEAPPGLGGGGPSLPGGGGSALASVSSLRYLASGAETWVDYDDEFVANDGSVDPFWQIKQGTANRGRAIYWLVGNAGAIRRVVGTAEKVDLDLTENPLNSWSDATAPTVAATHLARLASSIFVRNRHYAAANWQNASLQWRSWIVKTANDFVTTAYHALFEVSDVQTRLLCIAEDIQDGSRLWLTCWRDGTLRLERWVVSTMARDLTVSLGAATEAELTARTYWAEVAAAPGDKDEVYVFGRMNAPAGLVGTQHIIRSVDGGSSFTSFVSDWSADRCQALVVSLPDGDDLRTYYASRGV